MSLISPLATIPPPRAALFPRSAAQTPVDFAGALSVAREQDTAAQHGPRKRARDAASQLVATALVQPVLAELRSSPFKSELFHGGRGEEVFGQQLDTLLAERIAGSPGFAASDAVARQLSGGEGARATRETGVNTHG